MSNEQMDINGLVFSVQEGGSGSYDLDSDEWYVAVISKIYKEEAPFGWVLKWVFELQGEDFTYEKDGETKKRTVYGTTSLACSPKSRMYEWYCKLTGSEPEPGAELNLAQLINSTCRIMMDKPKATKKDPSKTYQSVGKVASLKGNAAQPAVASSPTAQVPPAQPPAGKTVKTAPTAINNNPGGVTTPDEIEIDGLFEDIA